MGCRARGGCWRSRCRWPRSFDTRHQPDPAAAPAAPSEADHSFGRAFFEFDSRGPARGHRVLSPRDRGRLRLRGEDFSRGSAAGTTAAEPRRWRGAGRAGGARRARQPSMAGGARLHGPPGVSGPRGAAAAGVALARAVRPPARAPRANSSSSGRCKICCPSCPSCFEITSGLDPALVGGRVAQQRQARARWPVVAQDRLVDLLSPAGPRSIQDAGANGWSQTARGWLRVAGGDQRGATTAHGACFLRVPRTCSSPRAAGLKRVLP